MAPHTLPSAVAFTVSVMCAGRSELKRMMKMEA